MATAIEFENISKQYRLGLVSTKTLSHDLNRWWQTSILGKEDPYLKIGEANDRSKKGESEYVWALKDINFKIEQGDVVGIIGKNGAGKSTLLKLLSRVTGPTTGTIRARGRIASLLEVGTGFHPEMTGRENIYLNGAIMGMTKQEIDRKLDEIVDFSGCERYLDTPVKRYSSGMTVRLGFAVAAHLDPEILVVDEVLAVGDAEFQKKAIGKMQDVSSGEGRTVLFVSHNMASIRSLCKSGILLKNGMIEYSGTAADTIDYYLSTRASYQDVVQIGKQHRDGETSKELEIIECTLLNDMHGMATDEPIVCDVKIKRNSPSIKKFTIGMAINNNQELRVGSYVSPVYNVPDKDEFIVRITLAKHNLAKGSYSLDFNVGLKDLSMGLRDYDVVHYVLYFDVVYQTLHPQTPIALWQGHWGNCNFTDAKIEIHGMFDYTFKSEKIH